MYIKMFKLTSVLLFLVVAGANAQKINEITGFQNPESVVIHKEHLFVSNMGDKTDLLLKDGMGYISMLSRKDGSIMEQKFISGLNAPKGMYVKGNTLYVTDIDRVLGFDIISKKQVWEVDLSPNGVTYANDISKASGGFYVSSTMNDAIYKVKKSGSVKQLQIKGDKTHGANGLYTRCGKLYAANYGRGGTPDGSFGKMGTCSKKFKEFDKGGAYDGIGWLKGNVIVTDWVNPSGDNGRLIMHKPGSDVMRIIDLGRPIGGPADLCVDKKNKIVWIPAQRENKLLWIPFDEIHRAQ
jgi:hypothetical protein